MPALLGTSGEALQETDFFMRNQDTGDSLKSWREVRVRCSWSSEERGTVPTGAGPDWTPRGTGRKGTFGREKTQGQQRQRDRKHSRLAWLSCGESMGVGGQTALVLDLHTERWPSRQREALCSGAMCGFFFLQRGVGMG